MKNLVRNLSIVVLLPLFTGLATAQTARTWIGAAGGDWSEAANWDPAGEPEAGDSVTINDGATVVLTNATAALVSFTLENATLTFTNWNTTLYAGTVTVGAGGIMTLPGPFDEGAVSNRIHIVCTNFMLAEDGLLDADGMGYDTGQGDGKGEIVSSRQSGGGYGGRGGDGGQDYIRRPVGGSPYGSAVYPTDPGSGGGIVSTLNGPGGGAIRIVADDTATIDGIISANGTPATRSCGSGGSILIIANVIEGNGTLRARGGTPNTFSEYWNPGGGGRIALHYTTLISTVGLSIDTRPGEGGWPFIVADEIEDRWMYRADLGTIWMSDTTLLNDGDIRNLYGQIMVPGLSEWTVQTLTIENSAVILGDEAGFTLTVQNDATLSANAFLQLARPEDNPWPDVATGAVMTVGGALTLTDDARLQLFAGETNLTQTAFGGELTVGGALTLDDESRLELVSHPVDGGSIRIRCATLDVAELARITAHGRGYAYMEGPGAGFVSGRGGGGGYGGHGGRATGANWGSGSTYGEPGWVDLQAGSGGGVQSGYRGGFGGGLIWLEIAGTALFDGMLSSKGNWTPHPYGGGGSGGGIFVAAQRFEGGVSGRLEADGGNAVYWTNYGGGGGGGRIAVWSRTPMESIQALAQTGEVQSGVFVVEPDPPATFGGTVSVDGGLGWADNQDPPPDEEEFSAPGSINFLRIVFRGSLIKMR